MRPVRDRYAGGFSGLNPWQRSVGRLGEALGGVTLEQWGAAGVLAVLGGGAILDQGEPGDVKFLHLVDGLADDRSHWQGQQRAHAGEHGGVDRIGLACAPAAWPKRRACQG